MPGLQRNRPLPVRIDEFSPLVVPPQGARLSWRLPSPDQAFPSVVIYRPPVSESWPLGMMRSLAGNPIPPEGGDAVIRG